ncbi:host cell factor homolog hcf-1-like isoform X2 [Chironomus tepperi]|uniref:host cell factor homolog hcf-1-like isoform X2 n=1 Tax=Chironomus tepperi TaxID=113505 RepID=UPI00391F2582
MVAKSVLALLASEWSFLVNESLFLEEWVNLDFTQTVFIWEKLPTALEGPCGRESHSAIFHYDEKENVKFLIVFGGMNTDRLGDLWFLDLNQLIWVQFEIDGIPPAPRSLHSASLIGTKMYIFGGWINRNPMKSTSDPPSERFETTNSLSYLDLEDLKWVHCEYNDDICPKNRAGHTAVAVKNRIYLWGGRSYYANAEDDSACTKDFWYLETELPPKVSNVSLVKATRTTLEIVWDNIDNAECYIVEIHKIQSVPIDLSKIRIKTNLPKTEQEKSADHIKGVSIKRKLEELEIVASKKINAAEVKEEPNPDDNLSDEKATESTTNENGDKNIDIKSITETKSDTEIKHESPIKSVQGIDKTWLTVGVYKSNSCIVDGFYTFKINTTNLSYRNCPEPKDLIPELKAHLTDNTMYAFRIAAINLMGIGEWSKMFYFKTGDVEMPSMPNNCKFIPSSQGLRLAWNPNPLQERITSYSVFIAINKNEDKSEFSFLRIYEGIQPTCNVLQNYINTAYQEKTGTSVFVIFRITACNSIGTSPPLLTTYHL